MKIIANTVACMGFIAAAQAAVIDVNLDNMQNGSAGGLIVTGADQSGTANIGVIYTDPAASTNDFATRTKAYTILGIDFDGDLLEDQATWTYQHIGNLTGINASGEGGTYTVLLPTITNSRAGYTSTITFLGFDEVRTNANTLDFFNMGTTGIGSTDLGVNLQGNQTITPPVQTVSVTWAADSFSSSTASYSFNVTTTIPEPSTVLLGGLGLFALLRRRRAA